MTDWEKVERQDIVDKSWKLAEKEGSQVAGELTNDRDNVESCSWRGPAAVVDLRMVCILEEKEDHT